jgi:amidophosphoribosyltransferase
MCAVVGVFNVKDASTKAYYSLFSMQHRGQESSGISSSDGVRHFVIKDRGEVTDVFNETKLSTLQGEMAVGHNRYSTAGDDSILDAQPVFARYDLGNISIVHNGNLTNKDEVRDALIQKGAIFQTHMDTENLIHLIAKSDENRLEDRIVDAVSKLKGAFSLIIMSRKKMYVIRDRYGFRPLSLATLDNGYIASSETCAFDLLGATYQREVKAGEMIVFKQGEEPRSKQLWEPEEFKCVFEHIYFARPDSNIFGENVYQNREQMGRELAKELPVDADVVIPVPDSGVAAALGYSKESGIPFELGIIRNHYVGRTFIEPTQKIRDLKVKMKLNPIINLIKGKKLVVIDDSIVRGTTSKRIVNMLKDAGAKEVHMRISAPPTTGSCFYGVDTPNKDELISSRMSIDEIRDYINADTLAYLSIDGLMRSIKNPSGYCKACFDDNYLEE